MKIDSSIKKDENSQVRQVNFYFTHIQKNKKQKKVFKINYNKNNKNNFIFLNNKNNLFFFSIGLYLFFTWITCLCFLGGFGL